MEAFPPPFSKLLHRSVTIKQTIAICKGSILLAGRRGGVESALRRGLSCRAGCSDGRQLNQSWLKEDRWVFSLFLAHTTACCWGEFLLACVSHTSARRLFLSAGQRVAAGMLSAPKSQELSPAFCGRKSSMGRVNNEPGAPEQD